VYVSTTDLIIVHSNYYQVYVSTTDLIIVHSNYYQVYVSTTDLMLILLLKSLLVIVVNDVKVMK
jgi:hypothetical protein